MKNEKGPVPLRYWALWWTLIVVADFVFYVLLTPIWIGPARASRGSPSSGARRTPLERRTSSGSSPSGPTA